MTVAACNRPVWVAATGSALLLLAALEFQYIGGLAPCDICIWQRWPHLGAVIAGVGALWWPGGWLWPAGGALATAATGGIGVYHTGIERGWWDGPQSCTGGGLEGLSGPALLSVEGGAMPVMCDAVVWEFLALSMASWNALASFALTGVWLLALRCRAGR